MKLGSWLKIYLFIRRKLNYSLIKDLLYPYMVLIRYFYKIASINMIKYMFYKRNVIVVGAGPSLNRTIKHIKHIYNSPDLNRNIIIVASDATVKPLINYNIVPHIIVSDLDGDLSSILKAEMMGSIVIVHSHGDNLPECMHYCKYLKRFILSTQVLPGLKIYNYGGFTDGDRAVFLAIRLKPVSIILFGMDFTKVDDIYPKTKKVDRKVKKVKLSIGKILMRMIRGDGVKLFTFMNKNLGCFKHIDLENIKKFMYSHSR